VIRARALGVAAALAAPACTRASVLRRLLATPGAAGHPPDRAGSGADRAGHHPDRAGHRPDRAGRGQDLAGHTRAAIAASGAMLRRLGRLGGGRAPWRDRCLHRSIAACIILRRHGHAAVLRIGVRADGDATVHSLSAHAWVEGADGVALYGSQLSHAALDAAAAAR